MQMSRDSEKCLNFRKQGNQFFSLKTQDYIRALELYNQSIYFAELYSEGMGIGYAHRSANHFEWKKYDLCMGNVFRNI